MTFAAYQRREIGCAKKNVEKHTDENNLLCYGKVDNGPELISFYSFFTITVGKFISDERNTTMK